MVLVGFVPPSLPFRASARFPSGIANHAHEPSSDSRCNPFNQPSPSAPFHSLCKRVEQKWPSSFKRDFLEQQPAGLSPAGVSEREAGASSVTGDPLRREKTPTVTGCEPLNRAPTPPAIPRKHERSPKVDLSTRKNFKAPEVSRQTGGMFVCCQRYT